MILHFVQIDETWLLHDGVMTDVSGSITVWKNRKRKIPREGITLVHQHNVRIRDRLKEASDDKRQALKAAR